MARPQSSVVGFLGHDMSSYKLDSIILEMDSRYVYQKIIRTYEYAL